MLTSKQNSEKNKSLGLAVVPIRKRIYSLLNKFLLLLAGPFIIFHLIIFIFALWTSCLLSFLNPVSSSLELQRYLEDHFKPKRARFVPLSKIPNYARNMVINLEDRNFYKHAGIELSAIINAFKQNARWGRIVLGGSTITQQLVRTLFLSPSKNYVRKYVEILWAVIMDLILSKDRILELYFNNIEWGKGVYGLAAAAQAQFGKSFAHLTYEEYARLIAIIINPVAYNIETLFEHSAMRLRYENLMGKLKIQAEPAETQVKTDQTENFSAKEKDLILIEKKSEEEIKEEGIKEENNE